jgi:hypothetical protein
VIDRRAIADTTILQYLHGIQRLELLSAFFSELSTTEAVLKELAAGRGKNDKLPGPGDLLGWQIVEVSSAPAFARKTWGLGNEACWLEPSRSNAPPYWTRNQPGWKLRGLLSRM